MNKVLGFFNENRYLSNFHLCPVVFEGIEYPSSEHAYQAAKFENPYIRLSISEIEKPKDAKNAGKSQGIRPDWDNIKYEIMYKIVLDKFTRNLDIQEKLINTKDAYLEETNWWHDLYYGVCTGERCRFAPHQRIGENNLGKILMSVRAKLSS